MPINEKFLKPYSPQDTENKIYSMWEKSGFFNPETCIEKGKTKKDAEVFSIVLPPPNVTGTLHIGHALMLVIEDIMIRFARMNGKRTLWLPGTDHAAIATQSKVEALLQKEERKRRYDLGREEFLKKVEAYAKSSHDTIVNQIRKMGSSVDWSREAFTLDEKRNLAVRTAFKKMYDNGLIYRGMKVINWDPKGQTVISDDEIEYKENKTTLYTFRYSKDFPIPIATTRPETKIGDTAVAVHPEDERYKNYIGKEYEVNFVDVKLKIKIVADLEVDRDFGTGAVGITPAHSKIDEEIARRHNLRSVQVIDEYARIKLPNSDLNGLKVDEARKKIVEWLKTNGLLEKEEIIVQNIATAERTGGIIEPIPKLQWFIDVDKKFKISSSRIRGIKSGSEVSLKDLMRKVVENGQIEIIPDRFKKIYFHWIDNLRDWCISRQIWYGHQIPVWYRKKTSDSEPQDSKYQDNTVELNNEIYCGVEAPSGDGWVQDEDTLDTWFSSGLWTFSTLGWPEYTEDLQTYHPTSVLETGYDILFFWVARMILMTTCLLGDIPFRTVYLHGLVRDGKGQKMSKSLGNIIDPLTMIEKYGADATRLSLIIGTGPGNDSKLSEDKIRGYKNFSNKIWNIARFVLENTEDAIGKIDFNNLTDNLTDTDKALKKEADKLFLEITHDMENFKFYLAGEKLYHYAWHTFADIILEESKKIFAEKSQVKISSRKHLLSYILRTLLICLHPFIPFVTEEIWQLMKNRELLMVEKWPSFENDL
jgi:valyl-tRNA synthetase